LSALRASRLKLLDLLGEVNVVIQTRNIAAADEAFAALASCLEVGTGRQVDRGSMLLLLGKAAALVGLVPDVTCVVRAHRKGEQVLQREVTIRLVCHHIVYDGQRLHGACGFRTAGDTLLGDCTDPHDQVAILTRNIDEPNLQSSIKPPAESTAADGASQHVSQTILADVPGYPLPECTVARPPREAAALNRHSEEELALFWLREVVQPLSDAVAAAAASCRCVHWERHSSRVADC